MAYYGHVFGNLVCALRQKRREGARIPDLLEFMKGALPGWRNGRAAYLNAAFCVKLDSALVLTPELNGDPDPDMLAWAEGRIEETRDRWETEEFPELRRLRDYF